MLHEAGAEEGFERVVGGAVLGLEVVVLVRVVLTFALEHESHGGAQGAGAAGSSAMDDNGRGGVEPSTIPSAQPSSRVPA